MLPTLDAHTASVHCGQEVSPNEKWEAKENLMLCNHDVSYLFGHRNRKNLQKCQKEAQTNGYVLAQRYAIDNVLSEGLVSHPVAYVNGKIIQGSLNSENIFSAICEAFMDPPAMCA